MQIDPEVTKYVLSVAAVSAGVATALSAWLGNVTAKRIERREQAGHLTDLERLRNDHARNLEMLRVEHAHGLEAVRAEHAAKFEHLRADHALTVEKLRDQLNLLREKSLKAHNLKIDLYREVTEPLIKFMIDVETGRLTEASHIGFNTERFRSYARLAMFAPQCVIDAYDQLVDFLNDLLEAKHGYDWAKIRTLSQAFLNAAREDVEIGEGTIVYKGKR